ncbi:hypothetical protein NDU88_001825 [Pleurodeles waltl]|uniref:Uncharacterized protein n=1 Tax=Pleurodeles waltl TaxID=8319 RepID=A0AAV7P884_PLEWA|nr:hypothetical protein NDU88_001825 [Pleurodeles waltl]
MTHETRTTDLSLANHTTRVCSGFIFIFHQSEPQSSPLSFHQPKTAAWHLGATYSLYIRILPWTGLATHPPNEDKGPIRLGKSSVPQGYPESNCKNAMESKADRHVTYSRLQSESLLPH